MRPVLPGLAIGFAAVLVTSAHAQQGSIQISATAQALTGDPSRIAGQARLEPDVGISWLQPGDRVVLTAGLPLHQPGTTNFLRVEVL